MAEKVLTRRHKALALVPLALVSGAWTASLVSFGNTANASASQHGKTLPDGTTVPTQAIEAPANLPTAGILAPGVPAGTADQVVDNASTSGIPSAALSAYQRAAQIIDAADTTCQIPWELIAAIGRVESDHGRYGGNVLDSEGVSQPGIYGIELDGKNGTQEVKDTDAGVIDNDTVYDRAVGPMQFIPSTWQIVKVDADGDGQRNPQDIDDASLATAVYLCSGDDDLSTRAGQESSVFRYNHSQEYVDLVLRLMQAYMAGDYTAVPNDASGGQLYGLADPTGLNDVRGKGKHKKAKAAVAAPATPPPAAPSVPTTPTQSGTPTKTPATIPSKPKPSVPATVPPIVKDPGGTVDNVTKPVIQLLTNAQALVLCQAKLATVPALQQILIPAGTAAKCATDLQGKTAADAANLLPGVLGGLLGGLGIKFP